jgi:hypothetical protein
MISTIRAALGASALAVLAVGCSVASSGNSGTEEAATVSAQSEALCMRPQDRFSQPDYRFYLVTHDKFGYAAAELGAPYTVCRDGFGRWQCRLDDLDFSLLAMTKGDIASIRDQVGSDPSSATLVFVGALTRTVEPGKGVIDLLQVKEMWRAPVAGKNVRASDTWFHVSHDPIQALVVNRWTTANVGKLDLAAAPWMSDCDPDGDGGVVCTQTQDGVLEDAKAAAGILVDGTLGRDGILSVRQYMAKIVIGEIHTDNGYWFCRNDQVACDNGRCVTDGANCDRQYWHGPGLKTIYVRSAATEVQPWLVQTSQLTAQESADLVAAPIP